MAKILLVEDDKSLREIYGVRLMAEGYEIVSAGDGEEALAMAIKERPNLIVSDVMMPKISGFDMLDILRSTTETKDVKVIMMTALSSDDQRARGEALGADRYLVKSQVGIEDVVRTVHDVLGDSLPGAAPAPSFPTAAPAPEPVAPVAEPVAAAPVAPVIPEFVAPVEPIAPVAPAPVAFEQPLPAPVAEPYVAPVATPAPIAEPVATAPNPYAAPVAPAPQPVAQPVINLPPAPAPAVPFTLPVPSTEALVAPVAPQPAPVTLPEPTAPFSSPRPASLGDRVINPITPTEASPTVDIAAQMNQELSTPVQPPLPPQPPVPPMPQL